MNSNFDFTVVIEGSMGTRKATSPASLSTALGPDALFVACRNSMGWDYHDPFNAYGGLVIPKDYSERAAAATSLAVFMSVQRAWGTTGNVRLDLYHQTNTLIANNRLAVDPSFRLNRDGGLVVNEMFLSHYGLRASPQTSEVVVSFRL